MAVLFVIFVRYSFADFYRFQHVSAKFCQYEESDSQVDAQKAFSTLFNTVVCFMVSVYSNFVAGDNGLQYRLLRKLCQFASNFCEIW